MTFQPRRTVLSLILLLFGTIMASCSNQPSLSATTPIQHVVVIFQENVSFDHYFATYPVAEDKTAGEPLFTAAPNTPWVNGLSDQLRNSNPNYRDKSKLGNPRRLSRAQAVTCDQDHDYGAEQKAFNGGLMNNFVESVGEKKTLKFCDAGYGPAIVMDYYDGNTVTALWNYAQNFAMSDYSFGTTFGPSTPGALNLISGQTHGATVTGLDPKQGAQDDPGYVSKGSVVGDPRPDPSLDDCFGSPELARGEPAPKHFIKVAGKNVGDLLNANNITWGWFQGGFKLKPIPPADGKTDMCGARHAGLAGEKASAAGDEGSKHWEVSSDYIPHHEPFQYYAQTANPQHKPPTSVQNIGKSDQAKHQYDLSDFFEALSAGNLPAVSYLKAPAYQDGHAQYSNPLDEQAFLVDTINKIMQSPFWSTTAIIVSYDDSDGWYDHVMGPIVNQSSTSEDNLYGPGSCGNGATEPYQGRCGYGPRLPLLVISPFAKVNYVDHTLTDQSAILRFIEDNWNLGRIGDGSTDAIAGSLLGMFQFQSPSAKPVILDPSTGTRKP